MCRYRTRVLVGCVLIGIICSFKSLVFALTPGNILISKDDVIYEYTKNGLFVQSFDVEYQGESSFRDARDLVVSNGKVLVYNGLYTPYLSTYTSGTWSHNTYDGWSAGGKVSYGGIATEGNYAFVTNMGTPQGVLRFELDSGEATPFTTGIAPIDLTIGLNGLLYVLFPGGSPGGRTVNVYDLDSTLLVDTIDLTAIFGWTEHCAIAVNASGELFIADCDGDLARIDADGNILHSINVKDFELDGQLYDIDVDASGVVIIGNRPGEVIITNESFSFVNSFVIDTSYGGSFVAFVSPSAPAGQHVLELSKTGTGTGSITSTPVGIDCGADCSEFYAAGTTVTLTATPDPDSIFTGWSGGGCNGTGTCTITMDSAVTVTAEFTLAFYPLSVSKTGAGTGSITSTPAGIDCGTDCSELYKEGTVVTLTATPDADSSFTGWSGGGCSGTGSCIMTIASAATVTAEFSLAFPPLIVSKAGTGTGSITSTPAGIDCGTDCTESYAAGTVVTLTATPGANSIFTAWSGGGCSGAGLCDVTLNAVTTVTAIFQDTASCSESSYLSLRSEEGDLVGAGKDYYYGEADLTTTVCTRDNTGDDLADYVTFSFDATNGDWWHLDVSTDELGTNLEPGFYDDTQRASFADPGHPGLSFSGNDRGCTTLTGNFTIYEAAFDYSGSSPQVISFAVSFEQHCEGNEEALFGDFRYNSPCPTTHHLLTVSKEGIGEGSITSTPAGIDCGTNCSESYEAGTTVNLTAAPDVNSNFSGWSGGGCSGTDGCTVTLNDDIAITATFHSTGVCGGADEVLNGTIKAGETISCRAVNSIRLLPDFHAEEGSEFRGYIE